jgi:hypothetical protein
LNTFQERKESGKRGRKPGRKASLEKIDMKAKLGNLFGFEVHAYVTLMNDVFLDRAESSKCPRMQSTQEASLSILGGTGHRPRKGRLRVAPRAGKVPSLGP